jgi:hypothetical protein
MAENMVERPATWRKVVAAILDFLTAFFVFGYAIAEMTGGRTESGFELNGLPALALFACIVAYFFIGYNYADGTIWQRIFRARG